LLLIETTLQQSKGGGGSLLPFCHPRISQDADNDHAENNITQPHHQKRTTKIRHKNRKLLTPLMPP